MPRERLPDRRPNQTIDMVYDGTCYAVTVGFHPDTGEPREVFTGGVKVGSTMDGILDDACILLSLLLQHHVKPAALARSMGRLGRGGQAASVIGALTGLLAERAPRTGGKLTCH